MIKLIRVLQEIDFHSKLSRAHPPDYYELGSTDFKPFDEDMEENVAPNHDGKSAPYGSGYKTFDEELEENFEDGKNPGRKGLSKRVGVSQKMSIAQLEKIAKTATGERRRMAQWNLNMKRGRNKK